MRMAELKDIIQDANINLLVGSGLSTPFLPLLGNIETLFSDLAQCKYPVKIKQLIEASLYLKYFDEVIVKNIEILKHSTLSVQVLSNYKNLLQALNSILLRRKSSILGKQINVFTTNIDVFLEVALEDLQIEYNDGFAGRFEPTFGLSNFRKSVFRQSLHFANVAEVPVFNIMKLHGSVTWITKANGNNIRFSKDQIHLENIQKKHLPNECRIDIEATSTLGELREKAVQAKYWKIVDEFRTLYNQLLIIINPTKEKFIHTLFNQTYYDLLRIYANELERENSVLFVMGFSFQDEHIRELTVRAANSNPTLRIIIFSFTTEEVNEFKSRLNMVGLRNRNVEILSLVNFCEQNGQTDNNNSKFDLPGLHEYVFNPLLKSITQSIDQTTI